MVGGRRERWTRHQGPRGVVECQADGAMERRLQGRMMRASARRGVEWGSAGGGRAGEGKGSEGVRAPPTARPCKQARNKAGEQAANKLGNKQANEWQTEPARWGLAVRRRSGRWWARGGGACFFSGVRRRFSPARVSKHARGKSTDGRRRYAVWCSEVAARRLSLEALRGGQRLRPATRAAQHSPTRPHTGR